MPATEAQIRASQINGARSKGPKTLEGKAVSRANALKHGLTGAGVVLLDGVSEVIEIRTANLLDEMKPSTEMGKLLVQRVAFLSVRMTRCTEQATEVVNLRVDKALRNFDDDRLDQADHLFGTLADNPSVVLRKLLRTEEGTRRLLKGWTDLKAALDHDRWMSGHGLRLAHLKGCRVDDCEVSHLIELSEALQTRLAQDTPFEVVAEARAARDLLAPIIEGEIEALTTHLGQIDPAGYDRDLAEVIAQARLDASSDVHQIQKYEASTERSLFRTLKEARLAEQTPVLADQPRGRSPKSSVASQASQTTSAALGSFSQTAIPAQGLPLEEDDTPLTPEERAEFEALMIEMGFPLPVRNSEISEFGQGMTATRRVE